MIYLKKSTDLSARGPKIRGPSTATNGATMDIIQA